MGDFLMTRNELGHVRFSYGSQGRELALAHREQLTAALPVIEQAMRPASKSEFVTVIETLEQVYFSRTRSAEQQELWLSAYWEALNHWPAAILWQAVRRWMADGASRFPSPSDLKRIIKPELREAFAVLHRARSAVAYLEANPDARPHVDDTPRGDKSPLIVELIAEVAKARGRGDLPSREVRRQLDVHAGIPSVDAARRELKRDIEAERREQARRNAEFRTSVMRNRQPEKVRDFISRYGETLTPPTDAA